MLTAAWGLQGRLLYFPGDLAGDPADAGLSAAREVSFVTEDGVSLSGWYLPPAGPGPAAAALVCNGNAGSRADRAPLAAALAEMGLGVLLFDYRGYAGNPGSPSEEGLAADARAARAWLEDRPEVDPTRVVLYGESLGAAVAARLAAEAAPAALVLRSPFTGLADIARHHYRFLPAVIVRERYRVVEHVATVDAPVLVVAGEADSIVPLAHSRAVVEAAGGSAQLVVVAGADHNDRALLDGQVLLAEVRDLLSRTVR